MSDIAKVLEWAKRHQHSDSPGLANIAETLLDLHARVQQLEAERDQAKAEAAVLWKKLNEVLDKAHTLVETFSDVSKEFEMGGKHTAMCIYNSLFKATEDPIPIATAFLAEHERLKKLVENGTDAELIDQQQAMQEEIARLNANQRTPHTYESCVRCESSEFATRCDSFQPETCPIRAAKESE